MAVLVEPRLRIEPQPAAPAVRPFLTAAWRDFLMVSYEIEPRVLTPFVPRGTELDLWNGGAFVSLVGFRFCDARLFGVRIPWHQEFAEVNLRFYVRRRVGDAWRRGVVFARELAAKRAVAVIARWFYGERFRRVPLVCRIDREVGRENALEPPRAIEYCWRDRGANFRLGAVVDGPAILPARGSLAEFVVEHYWAYTASARGGPTTEYLVAHPPWRIAPANAEFTGDAYRQYGPRFAPFLRGEPASAFWAEGSPVSAYRIARVPTLKATGSAGGRHWARYG